MLFLTHNSKHTLCIKKKSNEISILPWVPSSRCDDSRMGNRSTGSWSPQCKQPPQVFPGPHEPEGDTQGGTYRRVNQPRQASRRWGGHESKRDERSPGNQWEFDSGEERSRVYQEARLKVGSRETAGGSGQGRWVGGGSGRRGQKRRKIKALKPLEIQPEVDGAQCAEAWLPVCVSLSRSPRLARYWYFKKFLFFNCDWNR